MVHGSSRPRLPHSPSERGPLRLSLRSGAAPPPCALSVSPPWPCSRSPRPARGGAPGRSARPTPRPTSRRRRSRCSRPRQAVLIHEGQDGRLAARRALVLPPGRHLRRRGRALVRPARPQRLEADPRAAQLERHRPDRRQGQSVGWYRKEFTLPKAPKDGQARFWKVRFEGANYRAKVWLNGTPDRQLHRLLPVRGST